MASLESVIAGIPGLAGYYASKQERERSDALRSQENTQAIAQAGALATLQSHLVGAQREAQMRAELAGLPPEQRTPESLSAIAAKYGSAKDLLTHADTLTRVAANREATMARLQQAAQQFSSNYGLKIRSAANADERTRLTRERNMVLEALGRQAQTIAGQKLYYETGMTAPDMPLQVSTPPAPQMASPTAISGSTPSADLNLSGLNPGQAGRLAATDPTFAQAMREAGAGQMVPRPMPSPAPAPVVAPQQPEGVSYPDASNLDARDIRSRQMPAPAVPAPAPIAAAAQPEPAAPKALTLADAPAELSPKKKQEWLLKQTTQAATKAPDTVVDAIVQGRMQLPTGFALRSPYWQDVIERVNVKDPQFDATRYGARAAARRTFASGPEAKNVTALNTVIGHLGTLDEAATALQNGDIPAVNAIVNRARTEFGDPRVQNFDTAKQAVAEETMRVFRQVGASEMEARQWQERIRSQGSPAQLRGVISELGQLLESRVTALAQQYERTVNGQGNPAAVDPANKARLDKLIQQGAQGWDAEKEKRYQELLRKRGGGS